MKVLDDSSKWSKEFVCKECGAKLEVEESDLRVVYVGTNYGGDSSQPVVGFECAVCCSLNQAGNKVPSGMRDKILQKLRR